jgi:DNA polymerase-3 subunit delta
MSKGRSLLFLGPEIGEKQDAINGIQRDLEKQYGDPAEKTSFYAGETPVNTMVSVLRNGSLFASSRLFFIKNAEIIKKKDETELLASYMASPQDDTTLILLSEATSLDKKLEKAIKPADKRIFWELFENKKQEWVTNFFRREGFRITPDGIETVLELVENNTESLRRECSRLCLFLDKAQPVGEAEVEKWLSHTREESAFTLFARLSEGDLSRSLETLHTLLGAKESPQAILGALAWCFRTLRSYNGLVDKGVSNDFEFAKIGLRSSIKRKNYTRARSTGLNPDLCLGLTAEYDLLLRSIGSGFETVLMDVYLCKILGNVSSPDGRR